VIPASHVKRVQPARVGHMATHVPEFHGSPTGGTDESSIDDGLRAQHRAQFRRRLRYSNAKTAQ
jgi:hypothetical protein